IEAAGDEGIRNNDGPFEQLNIELPFVPSPSISPATTEAAAQPIAETPTEVSSATGAETISISVGSAGADAFVARQETQSPKRPLFRLRPRQKRQALVAASIAIAAALGAVVGAAASGAFSKPALTELAVEEKKATQQSVARLAQEVTNLKASLDVASKSTNS